MSEETPAKIITRDFNLLSRLHNEVNLMSLLGVLIRGRYSIGLTEEQIKEDSRLVDQEMFCELEKLEKGGFVDSFLGQEGTSGPYVRRYRFVDGVEIKLEISRPPQK